MTAENGTTGQAPATRNGVAGASTDNPPLVPQGETKTTTAHGYYAFSRPEIQALVPFSAKRILDVGCAAGTLGHALKLRQPCEVTGIEYVPDVAAAAGSVLDHIHVGDVGEIAPTLPRDYFDCIVMADVLEHLADPPAVLAALLATLARDGQFVISIPNVRHWSVLRGLLEGHWAYQDAGILDRTHLRFFTRSSFEELLRTAGLVPVSVSTTTVNYPGISAQLVASLRQVGLDISTLEAESQAYQFLYVAEPTAVARRRAMTSIIILTLNQLEDTRLCLDSISRHTAEPHELIVVDNGSSDGTIDYIRSYATTHDNVRVIANSTNRGFAAGNNQGLALAEGENVVLLNNDTIVTGGWLHRMLAVFERHPETGIVGPRAHHVSGPQEVSEARYKSVEEMERFADQWSVGHAGESTTAMRLVGFCLLIRRSGIEKIGGLDERFGSGNFEDDDFCVRAALNGFEARIAQDVFIHHTGGQTFKGAGINYSESMMRNWGLFKAKWGIPQDTPLAAGYTIPAKVPAAALAPIPLSNLHADHHPDGRGRWWTDMELGKLPITAAGDTSRPISAVIISSGVTNGFWASLVECSSVPLAARTVGPTVRPSGQLGKGWSVEPSDRSAVSLLNEMLLAAGDDPVLLVSSNVIFTPDWLAPILAVFSVDSAIAVAGPTSRKAPAPQQVRGKYEGTGRELRRFAAHRAKSHTGEMAEAPYLGGFCLAFNRQVCRMVGPLDDLDLQTALWQYFGRLQQAGYKLVSARDSYVHLDKLSDGEGAGYDELASAQEAMAQALVSGQTALEAGDLETAAREFGAVAQQYPDLAAVQTALGSTLLSSGRVSEAIPPLRRAGELAPNSAATHNQLGVALYQTGEQAEAETCFRTAIAAEPNDVQAYLNLIDMYRAQDRYTEATEEVKHALRIDPDNADVLASMAVLSLELGDREAADMAINRIDRVQPDHPALVQLQQAIQGVPATI